MQFQEQHIRIFLLRAINNTNTSDEPTCHTALLPLVLTSIPKNAQHF